MKSLSTIERLLELNAWMDSGYHVELRETAHIPQGVIAKASGVTQGAVSKWEATPPKRRPSGDKALAYHRALRALADAKGFA